MAFERVNNTIDNALEYTFRHPIKAAENVFFAGALLIAVSSIGDAIERRKRHQEMERYREELYAGQETDDQQTY